MRRSDSHLPTTLFLAACPLAVLLFAPAAATAQLTYTLDQTLAVPAWPDYDSANHVPPIVDLDGDGDLDIIAGYLYLNDGAGGYTTDGVIWGTVSLGDFNGDGELDLIRCLPSYCETPEIFLRTGPASFTQTWTFPYSFYLTRGWEALIGDLDGDGDDDIVGRVGYGGLVGVALSNGDGTFTQTEFQGPYFYQALSLGDLDADGDLDLVVSTYYSLDPVVYENNGSGSFTQFGTIPRSCDSDLDGFRFGDLNGDGFADDLVHWCGGSTYFALGDGDLTVGPSSSAGCPYVYPKRFLDVDFDGDLDYAGARIGFNDGTGSTESCLFVGYGSFSTNYGDLDGDGDFDAVDGAGNIWLASGATLDSDGDGVNDDEDNCPDVANPEQTDTDLDGAGDACDDDDDGDAIPDGADNCPFKANVDQIDLDGDGIGDLCDADLDGDAVCDDPAIQVGCSGGPDNCPFDPNPFQTDTDGDGAGDACDEDDDNDGICDTDQAGTACAAGPDNCPTVVNPDQSDAPDGDGIGDVCDADDDNDGANDDVDNCPLTANPDQNDTDGDGLGDACDDDDDGDGVLDVADNCPFVANPDQADADGDFIGDACNDAYDLDGDDWADELDNCPEWPNSDQADLDGDGVGDACDPDIDGDGVGNGADLCPGTPQGELVNPENGCTLRQLCPYDGPRGTNQPWKNHGKCLSCVAKAAKTFLDLGLIDEVTHGEIVSEIAQSDCGK